MMGFITDDNLDLAEEDFPGIQAFFAALTTKPRTFLDLLAEFDHWRDVRTYFDSRHAKAQRDQLCTHAGDDADVAAVRR